MLKLNNPVTGLFFIGFFYCLLSYSDFIKADNHSYLNIDFTASEKNEELSGGSGSVKARNKNAFSLPMKNIAKEKKIDFLIGNGLFKRMWIPFSLSQVSSDGLGPLFNAKSCQSCHIKDGRGHPPLANNLDEDAISMSLHLSIPPENSDEINLLYALKSKAIPDPIYGSQLSDFSIDGVLSEGNIFIEYDYIPVIFNNGKVVILSKPKYSIINTKYGKLHSDIRISARVAQPMIGLGLIESIDHKDILAKIKDSELDADKISGKANYVWDYEEKKISLGLFGWKATQPSVRQQAADALHNDMGLSTTLFIEGDNCTVNQTQCKDLPNGNTKRYNDVEVSDHQLDLIEFYSTHLAVPERRNYNDPNVLEGKKIFFKSGCTSCHTPKFKTIENKYSRALSNQIIRPYSDFLLHDMGPGLADENTEFLADGSEWRTQPLWGIGLTKEVSGHTNFLHDGRAKNILEAILWHGGEAERSKNKILKLSKIEINQLIDFIESL